MGWRRSLVLMAASTAPMHAGWKITTQTSTGSDRSVVTEYFSGGLQRTDYADPTGRRYVTVLDSTHPRQIIWNMDLRQYVVVRLTRSDPLPLSQQTIVIDQVTTDTGERRTFFGRTARRLVTHETSHVEGDATGTQERQTDGWYVDADTLPREKRSGFVHFLATGNTRPNMKVNRSGPATTGLAVWQKITFTSPAGTHEWIVEVPELVEGPLGKDLFEPPKGFRRVICFP
jgi:hypothetical protein